MIFAEMMVPFVQPSVEKCLVGYVNTAEIFRADSKRKEKCLKRGECQKELFYFRNVCTDI
jgi:hypothetical protein